MIVLFCILQLFDDKGCNREVLDIRVKCTNSTRDCHWVGELRDLEVHYVWFLSSIIDAFSNSFKNSRLHHLVNWKLFIDAMLVNILSDEVKVFIMHLVFMMHMCCFNWYEAQKFWKSSERTCIATMKIKFINDFPESL